MDLKLTDRQTDEPTLSGDILNLNSEFMRHVADDGEDDDATEDARQTISYRDHSRIPTETRYTISGGCRISQRDIIL